MKLLLDENLPKKLKKQLSVEHIAATVRDIGWQSKKNGELMKLMVEEKIEVLITFDKNLQHQQNFEKYPFAILVLHAKSNSFQNIEPLLPKIKSALKKNLKAGAVIIQL